MIAGVVSHRERWKPSRSMGLCWESRTHFPVWRYASTVGTAPNGYSLGKYAEILLFSRARCTLPRDAFGFSVNDFRKPGVPEGFSSLSVLAVFLASKRAELGGGDGHSCTCFILRAFAQQSETVEWS